MTYAELLKILNESAEADFAAFQRRLIFTKQTILGVRTPKMREIAKLFRNDVENVMSFPSEFFEVTFIKLAAVSSLPFEEFLRHVDECVSLIDNWASCDCFKPKCIAKNKEAFLPYIEKYFSANTDRNEFPQRFALVSLLGFYVEERYLPCIKNYLRRADAEKYYIHMAAAWLTAEILVKHFGEGVKILEEKILPPKTHDKAIQKAKESFRITISQKEFLETLKIKKVR